MPDAAFFRLALYARRLRDQPKGRGKSFSIERALRVARHRTPYELRVHDRLPIFIEKPSWLKRHSVIHYLSSPAPNKSIFSFNAVVLRSSTPIAASTIAHRSVRPFQFQKANICTIEYIIYNQCGCWVPQPYGLNGNMLRICRQAEEERLGFACPKSERDHEVIDRSEAFCKEYLWKQILH